MAKKSSDDGANDGKKKNRAKKARSRAGGGGALKKLPTLPTGFVAVTARDFHHVQAIRKKTIEAEAAWITWEEMKAAVKRQRAEAQELDAELRRMIRNGPDDPMLFDKRAAPSDDSAERGPQGELLIKWDVAAPETGKSNDGATSAPTSDAWKTAPLVATLKAKKNPTLNKSLEMIAKAGYETIGALEELRASSFNGQWFDKVPGLGRVGADEVENAVIDWLAKFHGATAKAEQAVDGQERKENAQAMAAALLPWREEVLKVIKQLFDFPAEPTAAKVRKILKNTGGSDPVIGSVWTCSATGIIVEQYQNQLLPTEGNVIPYGEASALLMKLTAASKPVAEPAAEKPAKKSKSKAGGEKATSEAPTRYEDDPSPAVLAKYFIERLGIESEVDAAQLKEFVCPAGGTHLGIHWHTLDDGVHYSGAGIEGDGLLTYVDAAALVNQRLAEME